MGDARRVVLLTAIHLGYRFLSLSRKVILYLLYEITPRLKKKKHGSSAPGCVQWLPKCTSEFPYVTRNNEFDHTKTYSTV